MDQAPIKIGQYVLGKNLGIGAFGKVSYYDVNPRKVMCVFSECVDEIFLVLYCVPCIVSPFFLCILNMKRLC